MNNVETLLSVDELSVLEAFVTYTLNAAPGTLDVAGMQGTALAASSSLGPLYAMKLSYELYLPDGRVAFYETDDRVTLTPSATDGARLLNAAELGLPTDYRLALAALLRAQGVSDRVVRYCTNIEQFSLERV